MVQKKEARSKSTKNQNKGAEKEIVLRAPTKERAEKVKAEVKPDKKAVTVPASVAKLSTPTAKPKNVQVQSHEKTQKSEKAEAPSKPRRRENAAGKHHPSRKPKGPKKEGRKKAKPVKSAYVKVWEETKLHLQYCFRQHWLLVSFIICAVMLLLALYFAVDKLDDQRTPPVTDKVTFRFAVDGTDIGSVQFGLFGSTCPLTVKNFIMLATHEKGYGYIGSKIHLVVPVHLMVGGDITMGNGTGGRSALSQPFENENLRVHHSGPGYLGMLPLDDNRNSSRTSIFYVTINAMPNMDRKSVAFGMVLQGMDVIKKIEAVDVDKAMMPLNNVTIIDASHSPA